MYYCSCDSIEKLKKRCDTFDREIKDQWKFKEFYQFTFNFAKNPGQKSLGNCIGPGVSGRESVGVCIQ